MEHPIDTSVISFRIGVPQWLSDVRFQGLMALFEKHKGVTDEITFFTSETHPPLPLNTIRKRAEVLAQRMPVVRDLGCRTGINVLATLGHHSENLRDSLAADYTRVMGLDGTVCMGTFCPNDEGMWEYVRELYRIVVSAGPDYVWIDDDVRLCGHAPVRYGCFCDRCLELFEEECGIRHTRTSLKVAFDSGRIETRLATRRAWLNHNQKTMARLLRLIETVVHEVKPRLPLGFMTGDRFYEGYDFDTWASVLSGPNKAEVMWRPGGGTYTEERLDDIIYKAHQIGRQIAILPPTVVSIQSEIENFPYQRLKKSARATTLEASCYVAGGCTGAAFNVLSMYGEPLDEYEPLVSELRRHRPFLDLLARHVGRATPLGIYTGWVKGSSVARNPSEGSWLGDGSDPATHHADELLSTGFPTAYSCAGSCAMAVSGDSVLALSTKEVVAMLSGGVYMDAQALNRLNALGYEELTGFATQNMHDADCMEELVEHPLNAGTTGASFAGRRRDGRQSFWKCPAYALRQTNSASEVLACMVDYGDRIVADCCMGVFLNRLGGRVCVAGYCPWTHLQTLSKSTQLKSLMRWLSADTLPAYVASFHRANLWVREPDKGHLAVALVNPYLDPARDLVLMLRTDRDELDGFDMQCRKARVRVSATDGPYREFVIPEVGAWEMRLVSA